MSWFKRPGMLKGDGRLGSPARLSPGRNSPGRQAKHAPDMQPAVLGRPRSGTDPETCLEVFRSHWLQAVTIMNKANGAPAAARRGGLGEEVSAVRQHVDQMALLLLEEEGAGADHAGQGPVLQYTLQEDVFAKLLTWAGRVGEHGGSLRLHQLKMYELLVSQANQRLLVHKPVIRPLLALLSACAQSPCGPVETHVILLLHQLCVCVTQEPALLELLFNASGDHGPAKFLMFSLLIPYVHREGSVGQQARDALLLIMALSSQHEHIGRYVAQHSDFCPVLATGLSGLYSSLPRKWPVPADDWFRLTEEDVTATPDLAMFLNSLEFCNAVVQVAHPIVRDQLLTFIHNGFLVPVIGPALHQNQDFFLKNTKLEDLDDSLEVEYYTDFDEGDISKLPSSIVECYYGNSMEEVITATVYLELFIRRITEPALLRTFLNFILTQMHDDIVILDSLITRISTNSRLCMVSLSLFHTLVDLNCEDVMYQLIFKYLLPCSHVMVSQRRCVKDVDLYSRTSEKFLSLTPACCMPDISDTPPEGLSVPPSPETVSLQFFPDPELPTLNEAGPSRSPIKRLNPFRRHTKVPIYAPGLGLRRSSSPDLGSVNPPNSFGSRLEHFETSYIEYLESARRQIGDCMSACQCWSAQYDGDDPSPEALATIESPSTDGTLSPDQEALPVNFQSVLSSTPKKAEAPDLSQSPQDSGVCVKTGCESENSGSSDTSDKAECSVKGVVKDGVMIESHGQSPSLELSILSDATDSDCKSSPREQCKSSPRSGATEDKVAIISESTRPGVLGRDSCAESVTSEADSALSGSSCATDNAGGSGDTAGSRSDSPLNDNFQAQEFNAFLLNLKRVKTPVEFCDNMEDSLCEMDALIKDLRQVSPPSSRERGSSQTRSSPTRDLSHPQSQDALPQFTASHNSTHPTLIKPCANRDPVPSQCDSAAHPPSSHPPPSQPSSSEQRRSSSPPVGLPGTLEERLSEFESERSVKPKLETVPRRSSSVSDGESRSGSLSAFGPPRAALAAQRYSFGSPNIGGFLTALLNKLETMMANSLYVNLLLTGLLARLAYYPQPLLRSFLLNHALVFQPTVKSLVQVLGSVKHKVDCYSYTVKDFECLLLRARRFMSWREGTLLGEDGTRKRSDSVTSLHGHRSNFDRGDKRRSSSVLGDLFRRNSPASKGRGAKDPRLQNVGDGYRYINRGGSPDPKASGVDHMESVKTKNAVYCAIILEEFLKELAAICQEHAVASSGVQEVTTAS